MNKLSSMASSLSNDKKKKFLSLLNHQAQYKLI